MIFDWHALFFEPLVLMLFTIVTGLLLGQIRIKSFSFGSSGVLFCGLIVGYFAFKNAVASSGHAIYGKSATELIDMNIVDNRYFTLFLLLFVVAVGLLAAKDLDVVLKRYGLKFMVLGFVVTGVGALCTYGATYLPLSSYEVAGVYTGALTSSPGLAAGIETAARHATEKALEEGLTAERTRSSVEAAKAGIGAGYAVSYPFGVLVVILGMTLFPWLFGVDVEKEKALFIREIKAQRGEGPEPSGFDLIGFSLTCLLGYGFGSVSVDLSWLGLGIGQFSLGTTGGALIVALGLGYIGRLGPVHFRMNNGHLALVRELALVFFLAIVGLKYGYAAFTSVMGSGLYLALLSLVIGFIAMVSGFVVGRYVFKLNWVMLSGAICGGMTSTPGLGAAIDAIGSDDPAAGYGATYPFALFGMVLFTILLMG